MKPKTFGNKNNRDLGVGCAHTVITNIMMGDDAGQP